MPRGRPPLQRTKEDAKMARKVQVRRNVQAYRQRKHANGRSEDSHPPPKEPFTFVLEQWGQSDPPVRLDTDLDTLPALPLEQHCDFVEGGHGRRFVHHIAKFDAHSKVTQDSTMFGGFEYLVELPPEIHVAQVSRQQFASNAATAFLPARRTRDTFSSETGPHWAQLIPDLVNRNDVLDSSIQALCLMQISHVKQERWLLRSSLDFYDKALQALQGALAQPTKAFRAEIFAAAMALATYELLQGTDAGKSRGWMHHIEGASSYLNAFPELDVCSFSHQLSFHFLETICIFDALGARKPSCFSTSKWWRSTVDRFGDQNYGALLRMITSLPTVLQQCDESLALRASVEAYKRWSTLLQMAFRMENAFLDWFQMTTAQLSLCEPTATSTLQETSDLGTSHPAISFPNLYTARLYLLYWSSMILLYESVVDLLRKTQAYSEAGNPDSCDLHDPIYNTSMLERYTGLAYTFATNIRQSISFCVQSKNGVIGKTLILLPLWIARNRFRKCDDGQTRWCSALLDQLGQRNLTFGLRVRKSTSHTALG